MAVGWCLVFVGGNPGGAKLWKGPHLEEAAPYHSSKPDCRRGGGPQKIPAGTGVGVGFHLSTHFCVYQTKPFQP